MNDASMTAVRRTLRTFSPDVINAGIIRDYVRRELLEAVLGRVYDIGMGELVFGIGAARYPAQPAVQLAALRAIVDIGIPGQVGLVDASGDALPGVIALGELELDQARLSAQGDRYIGDLKPLASTAVELTDREVMDALSYQPPDGFESVVVTENPDGQLSPPVADVADPNEYGLSMEQIIMARREFRKRRAASNAGKRGTNGDGTDGRRE